jgi:hypothetical protein
MTRATQRILAVASLLTAACNPYTVSNTVRLRDPSRAALGSSSGVTLPEGKNPERVKIASGFVLTSPSSRAAYEVHALREQDGSIELEVDTKLGIQGGERHDLVNGAGDIVALSNGSGEVFTPATLGQPKASLPVCLYLWEVNRGVRPTPGVCGAPGFQGVLTTDWDNVAEIRRRKVVKYRAGALMWGIPLSTGAFVFGGLYIGLSPHDKGVIAGGSAALGIGVAILGLLGPFMFAPDRSELVYPPPDGTAR